MSASDSQTSDLEAFRQRVEQSATVIAGWEHMTFRERYNALSWSVGPPTEYERKKIILSIAAPEDTKAPFQGRIYLRRVRLNSGGYDKNGKYWGIDAPLFWVASDDGAIDFVLRASDRTSARRKVLALYPESKVAP